MKQSQSQNQNQNHLTERIHTIKRFDLNLLTMFEAVYIQRSVTKAAKLLEITPSAVSQALTRLREHFSDPLFIRQGQTLMATTIATNIHNTLGDAYDNLLARYQELNGRSENNRVVLNCSTYLASIILGPLIKIVDTISPGCKVIHTTHDYSVTSVDNVLTYRKADIVVDMNPHSSSARETHQLYEENFVVVCSKNHPRLTDKLTKSDAIKEQYALINSDSAPAVAGQRRFDELINGKKKVRFIAASVISVIAIVESSDALGIIPQAAYERSKKGYQIRPLETDFILPRLPIYMVYNKSSLNSQFFSTLVQELKNHFFK
ncbi:LysR family transcriptional regulator [Budvicia diplopodorum]|uniref:LysR family transcriptional regulator n=1 Tax=Budvicia diplopodorum TaxID=1119056 RepID=UPI0013574B78|nr:LysR family transcriptional regulator [Budvicia diplopodorum]